MPALSILLQLFIETVLTRCIYLRYFHPLARYPGPFFASFTNLCYAQTTLPLSPTGCLPSLNHVCRKFITYFSGKAHLVEQALHDTYGPVIRTGPTSLSFSSLAAFDAIYGFNRYLEKGDFYDFGRDAGSGRESVFIARTEAAHREHRRKVVGPALSAGRIAEHTPVVDKNLSIFLEHLAAQATSRADATVNVAPCVHRFTFNTTVEVIYGEGVFFQPYADDEGTRDVLTGFRDLSSLAWGCAILSWLGWLMSTRAVVYLTRWPAYDARGGVANLTAFAERSRDLISLHPERVVEASQPSILKCYLAVPDGDAKHMTPDQMFGECFNLMFAGMGSTAAALTAILYRLGSPSGHVWQTRIRLESKAETGAGDSSKVLLAVIKETMRLHAPFPTAFPRSITAGAESVIPDLAAPLPVGTTVASNTYILGRSKEIWGSDAHEWKPERWLVSGDEKQKLEDKFVAFSKGPRSCVGKGVAMLMIESAVVGVLEKWDITAKRSLSGISLLEMQYAECDIAFAEVSEA